MYCWASQWRWSAGQWTMPARRACKVRLQNPQCIADAIKGKKQQEEDRSDICYLLSPTFTFCSLSCFLPSTHSTSFSLPPSAYKWIHGELRGNIPLQYLAWVSYPLMFILFSSLFCHLVAPQASGLYPFPPHMLSCFSVLVGL